MEMRSLFTYDLFDYMRRCFQQSKNCRLLVHFSDLAITCLLIQKVKIGITILWISFISPTLRRNIQQFILRICDEWRWLKEKAFVPIFLCIDSSHFISIKKILICSIFRMLLFTANNCAGLRQFAYCFFRVIY